MYQALKNNTVQYLLDYEPTREQLAELGCDSYEEYHEPIKVETEQEKKSRIRELLVSQTLLSEISLEGVNFSDKEIGDIIVDRVFGGNPHAESALQAKTSAYLLSVFSGEPNTNLFEEITAKRSQINDIRNKLSLDSI